MTEPLTASIYYKLDYEDHPVETARNKLDFQALPVLAENVNYFKLDFQDAAQTIQHKLDYDRVHTIHTKLDYDALYAARIKLDYARTPTATIRYKMDYSQKRINKYAPHARVISFRWG